MSSLKSPKAPMVTAPALMHAPTVTLVQYWGAVVVWMVVISILSSDAFSASNTNRYIDPLLRLLFPHLSLPQLLLAHTIIRKAAHFGEFVVLGVLVFWACRRGRAPRWRWQWMLQALAITVSYALLDELHQAFVPSRTASLSDSGIDSLGALASQLVIYARYLIAIRRV